MLLCEIAGPARAVLAEHFAEVDCHPDVTELRALPSEVELLAAGFPCQDLSQAGTSRLYAEGHQVLLMSPLDLADEDWVAVVSNMGAPLVGRERLADSRNIARAVEIQQDLLGAKFRAVMPLAIGGGNGIQPLMAAAHLGLPMVDADTMGAFRSLPSQLRRCS